VLDHGQWHDLTVITRHLTDRLARLPAEEVLQEITSTGARNGIHLLPTLDQCHTSCSCSSRSALCKHAATALLQVARYLDTMPLVLLLLRGRSPVDFFAGLQDPDHPSLKNSHTPRHLPSPPATPAQTAHDQWERVAQPSLPPVPALPERPTTPVLAVVDGFDGRTLADLTAEAAQRAYALLSALIHPGTDAAHTAGNLAEAERSGASPTSRQLPTIPLQQRLRELQEATGLTKAELAQAVRDWGLGG
ncbi:SWIM zinc finger family protein, partial [Micromonospora tulbaghiae]